MGKYRIGSTVSYCGGQFIARVIPFIEAPVYESRKDDSFFNRPIMNWCEVISVSSNPNTFKVGEKYWFTDTDLGFEEYNVLSPIKIDGEDYA